MKRNPWLSSLFAKHRTRQSRRTSGRQSSFSTSRGQRTIESLEIRVLPAVLLQFDYSLDTNNFFDPAVPERRAALEAAGVAISTRLEDTLLEIIPHKENAADTWTAIYTNPSTGSQVSTVDLTIGESVVTVFAGARQLGSTLGIGGPGGFSASGTQAFLDRVRGRGQAGALLSSGSETDFALWGGTIAFDVDTNWHFGLETTGLDVSESDFLSVAMHELTHMFGFGTAASWDNQVSGGTFNGAASITEYDFSGSPPVDGDNAHWQDGLTDGGDETAMDPIILVGSRKLMTELDFAGLADIGWEVTANNGGGGGGGNSEVTIELADGVTHSLTIQDDGVVDNGMSEYVLDGGAAVAFDTAALNVIVNGGDMADLITIASIDGTFTANFTINAADGNDTLNVNHDAGDNVIYNGEGGDDDLSFTGAAVTTVMHTFDSATSGSVLFDDSLDSTVSYTGLEPILDNVAAVNRIFTFAAADDIITLADNTTTNDGISRITSLASSELVDFVHPTNSITIEAGAGNDSVTINALDALFAGNVVVNLDVGNDTINAGSSNIGVTAIGAAGNDTLNGSGFADSLLGDAGSDVLNGEAENDTLIGGSNADQLTGGAGNDIILGNGGNNDLLVGGSGNDILNGGSGSDIVSETNDADFVLTSTALTGNGNDTLIAIERAVLTAGASDNSIDAHGFVGTTTLNGAGGNDTVEGSEFADSITTGSGVDVVNGNGGDDLLFALDGNDAVDGGSGNDFADGGVGIDNVLGGDGNDVLVGGVGNDVVNGQAGDDIQYGGSGKDLLIGDVGDDQLNGQGSSGDTLTGGLGNDTLNGGGGSDFVQESGDVNFTLSALSLQGVGDDTLTSVERVVLTGGASANNIDVSGSTGSVTVLAGGGDDTVTGGSGFNVFLGDTGNDLLVGGSGVDFLLGASGADTLRGNGGNDVLRGQGGSNDRIFGGDGNDFIDGGSGGDRLFGENGDDTMHGLRGNDVMDGGAGHDSMLGGDGNDQMNGGDDNDTLNGGAGDDVLDGDDGNDGLSGFTGNDTMLGDYGNDTMYGGAGNDNMIGAAGADIVIGQADDDFVKGNGGSDLLAGGSGSGADAGDNVVGNPGEIDELFTLVEPDWVNNA